MADKQPVPKDPIQTRSLSKPIFLATAVLMVSFIVSMYDEFIWRRPYKAYQEEFISVYGNFLEKNLLPQQEARLAAIHERDDFKLALELRDSNIVIRDAAYVPIDIELSRLNENISRMNETLKVVRSEHSANTYLYDTAIDETSKAEAWSEMERLNKGPYTVTLLDAEGQDEDSSVSFGALKEMFLSAQARKAELQMSKVSNGLLVKKYQAIMDSIVADNLVGPRPGGVLKRLESIDARNVGAEAEPMGFGMGPLPNGKIMQIHVGELDWVDRCESCHIGTREPFEFTPQDLADATDDFEDSPFLAAFGSHPRRELLEIHDPSRFGCSMCHGGNGRSISDVKHAHGQNKHWLWRLHPSENIEAGCVQCHRDDLRLEHATVINDGKWLFYKKGCWGCHRYEGFDTEPENLKLTEKEIIAKTASRKRLQLDRELTEGAKDRQVIDLQMSALDTILAELNKDHASLEMERQQVGPDLKNVRAKLKPEFLVPWILEPEKFKPHTNMPTFRMEKAQAEAIAAFLWQASTRLPSKSASKGDIKRGKDLFETRGCLGCHTIEVPDGEPMGDGFATELSRIGDKAHYDFIVQWIKQPDSGIMPSLRLTDQDSEDIASYLFSRKKGSDFPDNPKLDDKSLFAEGKKLTRHFGCAGCHAIPGMEDEGRIGTELTTEGSKPKERLDFGRVEHDFKKEGRYTHKDFIETKLSEPAFFGQNKFFEDPLENLRMPNFRFDHKEITAVTTFLMGSIDSQIPQSFRYNPDSRQKAIQDGWWVVKKYNCVGCHQFEPGVEPVLWSLPIYTQTRSDGKNIIPPPTLVGQGFRTNPVWLSEFLENPALDGSDLYKNGMRDYLEVRMPTFRLSPREIAKLVRFFGALMSQPEPYVEEKLESLDQTELSHARTLFKHLTCVKCHAIGDPEHDRQANAPPLYLMGERMKAPWTRRWLENPAVMMPGTDMPSNFSWESEVKLKDGRTLVGILSIRKGKGTLTDMADKMVRFAESDIVSQRRTRMIAGGRVPESLRSYVGDFRELIVRYLHTQYTVEEIPFGMPDK